MLAPTHERFDPRTVTTQQLQERVVGLKKVLSDYGDSHLPVIAAGHSVEGWAALCLAGGQPWAQDGQAIAVTTEERVSQLVLYAPTVGWFRAPNALAQVHQPVIVHAGAADTVTPPATELPPGRTPTTGPDHRAFLSELAESVASDPAS